MAERAPLGSHKVWFGDDRTAARRLAVSSHPDEGVVVMSLWQHDRCSATFRLPLTDAPRLIAALAEALVPASELRRVE